DIGLEAFDLAVRRLVGLRRRCQRSGRAIALGVRAGRSLALRGEGKTRRLTAGVPRGQLGGARRRPPVQRGNPVAVAVGLLLLAGDREFARVCGLTRCGRPRLGLDQLDPEPAEIGIELADAGRRDRLALAGVAEPSPRRLDRLSELTVLPGEQHLLPLAQ